MSDQTKSDVERLRMDATHADDISCEECLSEMPHARESYREKASLLRRAADAMEELAKLQSAGGDVTQEDIDSLLTEAATYDLNATEPGIAEEQDKAFCVTEAAKLRRIVNAVVERAKLKTAMAAFEITMRAVYEERDRLKAENLEWLAAVRESYHASNYEDHAKAQRKLEDLRLGNADVNTPETVLESLRKERDRLREAVKVLRDTAKKIADSEPWQTLYDGGESYPDILNDVRGDLRHGIAHADAILAGKEGGRDDV